MYFLYYLKVSFMNNVKNNFSLNELYYTYLKINIVYINFEVISIKLILIMNIVII